MHLSTKSRTENWKTAYKNKIMLSPLEPAVGISVEPVCISAQESMKNMHMVMHTPHFRSIMWKLSDSYFFLHIIISFHSFTLAEYVEHL